MAVGSAILGTFVLPKLLCTGLAGIRVGISSAWRKCMLSHGCAQALGALLNACGPGEQLNRKCRPVLPTRLLTCICWHVKLHQAGQPRASWVRSLDNGRKAALLVTSGSVQLEAYSRMGAGTKECRCPCVSRERCHAQQRHQGFLLCWGAWQPAVVLASAQQERACNLS